MSDRERLRRLAAQGDFGASRELAREYRRAPNDEDGIVLASCDWVQLRGQAVHNFDAWRKFAELLLASPDVEDYEILNNAGRDHILGRDHADIMDAALAKIRRLLSIPEPFSIRNDPRFNRRRR